MNDGIQIRLQKDFLMGRAISFFFFSLWNHSCISQVQKYHLSTIKQAQLF